MVSNIFAAKGQSEQLLKSIKPYPRRCELS